MNPLLRKYISRNVRINNSDTLGHVELIVRLEQWNQGDQREQDDQGEVSIIIFGMSESSGFQKYSISWVFQALFSLKPLSISTKYNQPIYYEDAPVSCQLCLMMGGGVLIKICSKAVRSHLHFWWSWWWWWWWQWWRTLSHIDTQKPIYGILCLWEFGCTFFKHNRASSNYSSRCEHGGARHHNFIREQISGFGRWAARDKIMPRWHRDNQIRN